MEVPTLAESIEEGDSSSSTIITIHCDDGSERSVVANQAEFFNNGVFIDVMLNCEGQYIGAHKLVLASNSGYFYDYFMKNPGIVMSFSNLRFRDLENVIQYIYNGRIDIPKGELESFAALASFLKVQGLTLGTERELEDATNGANVGEVTLTTQSSSLPNESGGLKGDMNDADMVDDNRYILIDATQSTVTLSHSVENGGTSGGDVSSEDYSNDEELSPKVEQRSDAEHSPGSSIKDNGSASGSEEHSSLAKIGPDAEPEPAQLLPGEQEANSKADLREENDLDLVEQQSQIGKDYSVNSTMVSGDHDAGPTSSSDKSMYFEMRVRSSQVEQDASKKPKSVLKRNKIDENPQEEPRPSLIENETSSDPQPDTGEEATCAISGNERTLSRTLSLNEHSQLEARPSQTKNKINTLPAPVVEEKGTTDLFNLMCKESQIKHKLFQRQGKDAGMCFAAPSAMDERVTREKGASLPAPGKPLLSKSTPSKKTPRSISAEKANQNPPKRVKGIQGKKANLEPASGMIPVRCDICRLTSYRTVRCARCKQIICESNSCRGKRIRVGNISIPTTCLTCS